MKYRMTIVSAALLAALAAGTGAAQEMPDAGRECTTCHQVEKPGQTNLRALRDREAPPLYYAGNKFRRQWLVDWLQDPTRIRPSGTFFANHVETVDGEDRIDTDSLSEHMSLDPEQAEKFADWLMSLTPKEDLIESAADYTPGSVSPRMGAMDFVKFKGCGGCHKDTPEYGGVSGPELYTAWQRLQPEYLVSYIRDPQAWDPLAQMPDRDLNDDSIHKLVDYLKTLADEE